MTGVWTIIVSSGVDRYVKRGWRAEGMNSSLEFWATFNGNLQKSPAILTSVAKSYPNYKGFRPQRGRGSSTPQPLTPHK